jgi:hypothetical protein
LETWALSWYRRFESSPLRQFALFLASGIVVKPLEMSSQKFSSTLRTDGADRNVFRSGSFSS